MLENQGVQLSFTARSNGWAIYQGIPYEDIFTLDANGKPSRVNGPIQLTRGKPLIVWVCNDIQLSLEMTRFGTVRITGPKEHHKILRAWERQINGAKALEPTTVGRTTQDNLPLTASRCLFTVVSDQGPGILSRLQSLLFGPLPITFFPGLPSPELLAFGLSDGREPSILVNGQSTPNGNIAEIPAGASIGIKGSGICHLPAPVRPPREELMRRELEPYMGPQPIPRSPINNSTDKTPAALYERHIAKGLELIAQGAYDEAIDFFGQSEGIKDTNYRVSVQRISLNTLSAEEVMLRLLLAQREASWASEPQVITVLKPDVGMRATPRNEDDKFLLTQFSKELAILAAKAHVEALQSLRQGSVSMWGGSRVLGSTSLSKSNDAALFLIQHGITLRTESINFDHSLQLALKLAKGFQTLDEQTSFRSALTSLAIGAKLTVGRENLDSPPGPDRFSISHNAQNQQIIASFSRSAAVIARLDEESFQVTPVTTASANSVVLLLDESGRWNPVGSEGGTFTLESSLRIGFWELLP